MRLHLGWIFLVLCLFCGQADAFFDESAKKARMIQELAVIKNAFEVGYAPAEWKQKACGWSLEAEFKKSKEEILATSGITTKQFQQILRRFVKSTQDYHVDILFFSTEQASLPFSVRGAKGRYFIDWVDQLRLPPSHYCMNVGDELIAFDGRPIGEVIRELIEVSGKGANPKTDQAMGEIKLTIRGGMFGDDVPQGPLLIELQPKEGPRLAYQLRWTYTPEYIKNPLDFLSEKIAFLFPSPLPVSECTHKWLNPLHAALAKHTADHSGGMGARQSFVPILGEVIWSADQEDTFPLWDAYIYRHPVSDRPIGYLRIPHYNGNEKDLKELREIIEVMEETTDALVLDQLNNIGGSVRLQSVLASFFTNKPLSSLYHRIKITQEEAMEAHQAIEYFESLELMMNVQEEKEEFSDAQEEKQEEKKGRLYELDYQELLFFKSLEEHILAEWNRGHTLTAPIPLVGMDMINPDGQTYYSKPIVMLVNELDFSCADFMPAILQDNQRATIFGSRTAGAGGFVKWFSFLNQHGIALCSYTASLVDRPTAQGHTRKIEHVGVIPDIEYEITLEDMQEGYQDYGRAVNDAIEERLQ